jgi:hypothetical protein
LDAETALQRIQVARGCAVPDTEEQRDWIKRFAAEQLALGKKR